MLLEEGLVEGGGEGAEVEGAGVCGGGGGDDEVHGRAHRLHHLGREVVEADHRRALLIVVVAVVSGRENA